ncbi:glycosyltransferase family 2 protein [Vibrio cholerae]|uniref:glycosyltransferase family 2 protein n=1 Tax=Vibrio cholerae TaxID=666 RepID=UPI0011DACD31|nr:glycosyltransferase family 2 protein [Vibrio cholerae]TXY08147.1 glycosyltransferase family 2 protein [Vibrio cholerae]BCN17089.1 putative glycosyltransferase [Vibrio cholerae]GHY39496.1 Putative N-acetylgalactosaminyl-diphosphoundecaprenol glucuronosyltransferase [Vibrio cholerae]
MTNNESEELVSVIMPCFNSEAYLKDSINSVRMQIYSNWELIVIDNNSDDRSYEIAVNFSSIDNRIKVIKCVTPGASFARNKGIAASQGKYLAFLDSDDVWFPSKLVKQISFMKSNNSFFSCSSYIKIDSFGRVVGKHLLQDRITRKDLLRTCNVGCLSVVVDVSKFKNHAIPTFPNVRKEDYAYWFKLMDSLDVEYIHVIPEPLCSYRLHGGGVSNSKLREMPKQWAIYRSFLKLSYMRTIYYMCTYILYGILKTYIK